MNSCSLLLEHICVAVVFSDGFKISKRTYSRRPMNSSKNCSARNRPFVVEDDFSPIQWHWQYGQITSPASPTEFANHDLSQDIINGHRVRDLEFFNSVCCVHDESICGRGQHSWKFASQVHRLSCRAEKVIISFRWVDAEMNSTKFYECGRRCADSAHHAARIRDSSATSDVTILLRDRQILLSLTLQQMFVVLL